MEIPVCNRRCIDLQKKVRRPEGIALPFSTFRVAQRIGDISNKQIFFLLLCHSFYVPFQEDICHSETCEESRAICKGFFLPTVVRMTCVFKSAVLCHSEQGRQADEESHVTITWARFFISLRSIQNDITQQGVLHFAGDSSTLHVSK